MCKFPTLFRQIQIKRHNERVRGIRLEWKIEVSYLESLIETDDIGVAELGHDASLTV